MAPEKLLAEWFWIDRWMGSSAFLLPMEARGVYREMLTQAWRRGARLPNDHEAIRRAIGATVPEWRRSWPSLEKFWRVDGNALINDTQAEVYTDAQERAERASRKGRRGAQARAQALLKQSLSPAQAEPKQQSGAAQAVPEHKPPSPSLISLSGKEHQREKEPASLSPPADSGRDPFTDAGITERAGRFLDRYDALYPTHRHGARYARKPVRDYAAAVTLCETWADDDRLDKLAVIFLTTDHTFAAEGSRTVPQFLALASWCDGRLAEYEAKKGSAA